MASFITVDRKILKWEWYQDVKVFHLFLYFLLRANWEDGRWKGIEVKRGQLITGRLQLSKDTGLSEMEIRTCRKKLIATGEITVKITNKYSIITICKYDTYQTKYDQSNQQNNQQVNQQVTNEQPTSNQQVTTNNTLNNNKEESNNKKFNTMPTPECFNGLPEMTRGKAYELVFITQKVKLSNDDLDGMWEVFKIQHLTGKKWYAATEDVYSHYINWIKKQKFERNETGNGTGVTRFNKGAIQLIGKGKAAFDKARSDNS